MISGLQQQSGNDEMEEVVVTGVRGPQLNHNYVLAAMLSNNSVVRDAAQQAFMMQQTAEQAQVINAQNKVRERQDMLLESVHQRELNAVASAQYLDEMQTRGFALGMERTEFGSGWDEGDLSEWSVEQQLGFSADQNTPVFARTAAAGLEQFAGAVTGLGVRFIKGIAGIAQLAWLSTAKDLNSLSFGALFPESAAQAHQFEQQWGQIGAGYLSNPSTVVSDVVASGRNAINQYQVLADTGRHFSAGYVAGDSVIGDAVLFAASGGAGAVARGVYSGTRTVGTRLLEEMFSGPLAGSRRAQFGHLDLFGAGKSSLVKQESGGTLIFHENFGGHPVSLHVGWSDQQLLNRFIEEPGIPRGFKFYKFRNS